jgi:2-iminobutanoate/2-iminopropanoate deaminase
VLPVVTSPSFGPLAALNLDGPADSRLARARVSRRARNDMSGNGLRRIISKINKPIGPYSNGVIANGTLYVSGCIGQDATGTLADGVEAQCVRAMENMAVVLKEAGANFDDVVKTTILLRDMNDFAKVNEAYAKFFTNGLYPARSTFAVAGLPKNALIEIEATAVPHQTEENDG